MAAMCPLCLKLDGLGPLIAQYTTATGDVTCPRCGVFSVDQTFGSNQIEVSDEKLLMLSALTRQATDAGKPRITITHENHLALAAQTSPPRKMGDYYDRVLQLVAELCRYPGRATPSFALAPLAARAFLPEAACKAVLQQLSDFLQPEKTGGAFDELRLQYRLTARGWKRVDELTRLTRHEQSAFVAMWFAPRMRDAYEHGIKLALESCGYEPPFRVDDPHHQEGADHPDFKNRIDDRILAEIRRARFVVADATGARPSVYYEAGFADGLGTPVIWTCIEDEAGSLAFDTRQSEHILWRRPDDLKEQLIARIARRGWRRQ